MHRLLNVVDADALAEEGFSVAVGEFNGGSCEADERGPRQCITEVSCEPINQVVLAAVSLVGILRRALSMGNRAPGASGRNFWIVVKTTPPEAT